MMPVQVVYFEPNETAKIRENIFIKLHEIITMTSSPKVGWARKSENLNKIFDAVQGIRLKNGYNLELYVYGKQIICKNKSAVRESYYIFGYPQATICPDPSTASVTEEQFLNVKPPDALHFFQVIEGDKSPQSYLEASILYRILYQCHLCSCYFNLYPPTETDSYINQALKQNLLTWIKTPDNWRSTVACDKNGLVYVQFFSYVEIDQLAIYNNLDTYARLLFTDSEFGDFSSEYAFSSRNKTIAEGYRGLHFNFGR